MAAIDRHLVTLRWAHQHAAHGEHERAALRRWMLTVARTAQGVARLDADMPPVRMPRHANDATLLASARAFLETGRRFHDRFVTLGLDPAWAAHFTAAIDAFDSRVLRRRSATGDIAHAHTSLRETLADGFAAVRLLDVIVANRLHDDVVELSAWRRVRHVTRWAPKSPPAAA